MDGFAGAPECVVDEGFDMSGYWGVIWRDNCSVFIGEKRFLLGGASARAWLMNLPMIMTSCIEPELPVTECHLGWRSGAHLLRRRTQLPHVIFAALCLLQVQAG